MFLVGFGRFCFGGYYLGDVLGALTAGLEWLTYFYSTRRLKKA